MIFHIRITALNVNFNGLRSILFQLEKFTALDSSSRIKTEFGSEAKNLKLKSIHTDNIFNDFDFSYTQYSVQPVIFSSILTSPFAESESHNMIRLQASDIENET